MTLQQVIRDRLARLVRTVPVKGRWRAAGTLNRLFRAEPAAARLPGIGQVLLDLRHEDQSQVYWAGLSQDNALILDTLRAALPPGGVFLDVGANIGLHTLAIAHHLQPTGGTVLAFEPHPDNYWALRDNLHRNRLDNVTAENLGLAESAAVHTGAAPPGPGNWSLASQGQRSFKVHLVRFDDYARRHDLRRLDAVKIDVEGAEVRVLRGARESIERYRPVIVFEVCPMWLRRMGTSVAELFEVVQAPGYTVHHLPQRGRDWGRALQAADMDHLGPADWANLAAVPRRA
jgi:FkbM family methyltransferase